MKNPIRVLLVDDHTLFRESLARLLMGEPDFQVVNHCAAIAEAMQLLDTAAVDVVLLDYDLGEEFGTDLLRELRNRHSSTRVLMVTAGMRDSVMLAALGMGVSGVILKHCGPGQLMEAVRIVAMGGMWLDAEVMQTLHAAPGERAESAQTGQLLSKRQEQILKCILDGLTNKEIAVRLQISEATVKATIQELFNKAGVRTRSQLVKIAIERYSADWLADRS